MNIPTFDVLAILTWAVLAIGAGLSLIIIFGNKADAGLTAAQRLIRSCYRLSRWSMSVAIGLDAYVVAFHESQKSTELPQLKCQPWQKTKQHVDQTQPLLCTVGETGK